MRIAVGAGLHKESPASILGRAFVWYWFAGRLGRLAIIVVVSIVVRVSIIVSISLAFPALVVFAALLTFSSLAIQSLFEFGSETVSFGLSTPLGFLDTPPVI